MTAFDMQPSGARVMQAATTTVSYAKNDPMLASTDRRGVLADSCEPTPLEFARTYYTRYENHGSSVLVRAAY